MIRLKLVFCRGLRLQFASARSQFAGLGSVDTPLSCPGYLRVFGNFPDYSVDFEEALKRPQGVLWVALQEPGVSVRLNEAVDVCKVSGPRPHSRPDGGVCSSSDSR